MNEKLEKRVKAHATTIGVWLSSTTHQNENESLQDFKERLIALGAYHAMNKVNAPLLKEILKETNNVDPT